MSSSRRTSPLPKNWAKLRHRTLVAYGGRCALCDQSARQVDHIVPAAEGGSDELDNLQALCDPCHNRKTAQEANRARHAKPPAAPHPGMLRHATEGMDDVDS